MGHPQCSANLLQHRGSPSLGHLGYLRLRPQSFHDWAGPVLGPPGQPYQAPVGRAGLPFFSNCSSVVEITEAGKQKRIPMSSDYQS